MNPILQFPCYEPSGYRAELSVSDLVQHLLVIGSTGSGKSTLLTAATRQLLTHDSRPGLLILDAKLEGAVAQIRSDAGKAGRAQDVMVFGPEGDAAFDLFGGLRSIQDVERVTRRLMLGVEPFSRDNAYWQQATHGMVSAALAMLVSSGNVITFETAVGFMRDWFLSAQASPAVSERVDHLRSLAQPHLLLEAALDQVKLWETLESRTRSNVQSCLLHVLRPLLSPQAARSFTSGGRPLLSPALAATNGKVCIVSVPALSEPELAKFFFRLAKQEFFDAVQGRRQPPHGLCGLIADELPLVVTSDDVDQLGTVRSKNCFVLSATQGLDSLTQRLGIVAGRAIINHFNTTFYLRCREAETALAAFMALGMKQQKLRPPKLPEWGDTWPPVPQPAELEVPVCPIGALGRLAPHQAFLLFADGRRTLEAVWFVPWFEWAEPATPVIPPSIVESYFTAAHVRTLMKEAGFQPQLSATVVLAATKLERRRNRKALLKQVQAFFLHQAAMVPEGLELLPNSWLAALPKILWAARKPSWIRLPYFIDRIGLESGVLLVGFAQEQPNPEGRLTAWDRLRILVNAGVYPSRWRPLHRQHQSRLQQQFPELRVPLVAPDREIS